MAKISLKRKEIAVELEDGNGIVKNYTLRELDGTQRDKFLNIMSETMKNGPDGRPVGLKTFENFQANLLTKSLFDESNQPVPVQVIQTWPTSALTTLFDMAQKISALAPDAKVEAKND